MDMSKYLRTLPVFSAAIVVITAALVTWESAAQVLEKGRWKQLENNPSCRVWIPRSLFSILYDYDLAVITWSGACANGKAQGHGTSVWRVVDRLFSEKWKEHKYTGEMKGGKAQGRGVFVWPHDDRYSRSDKYEGEFKDGAPRGYGVKVWASGNKYKGDFKDGKPHGYGVMVHKYGKFEDVHRGEFRAGLKDGPGVTNYSNGNKCEGEWSGGKLKGLGKAWNNSKKRSMYCYVDGVYLRFID